MTIREEQVDTIQIAEALKEAGLVGAKRVIVRYDGRIDAGGGDNRILVRLNDATSGYTGFVTMDGHAGGGEWDQRGFYVGRNGWSLDAHLSFEVVISLMPGRKRVAHARSTFAHADERVLGFACHGFWANTSSSVATVSFWKVGPGSLVRDSRSITFEEE
jgi:hypothetical protein